MAGLGVLLVVAFVVIALINRGNQSSEDKSLLVYMPYDEAGVYEKISAEFLAANPGVELTFKFIDAKDAKEYEAQVVNEIADGAGPDIWLVRSDWIPKHAAKSIAIEVTSGTPDPIAAVKTVIEPALVDMNVYQGKLYGIPLFADSLAVIYNQDFYNNAAESLSDSDRGILGTFPATWALVKAQTALVTKKAGNVITRSGMALGTAETTYSPVDVLSALLLQRGATVLSEDEVSVTFNLAKFEGGKSVFPATEATDLFTSFARSSESSYSWNNDLGNATDAFTAGKTGAVIGYYSLVQGWLKQSLGFSMVITPLPQISAEGERVDFGVTWSHIVSGQTKSPSLARAYLSYLTRNDIQVAYAEETGKVSVLPIKLLTVPTSAVKSADAFRSLFISQLKTAKQLQKKEWIAVDEYLQDLIKLVVNSKQLPQTAVDSIAERMKELTQ